MAINIRYETVSGVIKVARQRSCMAASLWKIGSEWDTDAGKPSGDSECGRWGRHYYNYSSGANLLEFSKVLSGGEYAGVKQLFAWDDFGSSSGTLKLKKIISMCCFGRYNLAQSKAFWTTYCGLSSNMYPVLMENCYRRKNATGYSYTFTA